MKISKNDLLTLDIVDMTNLGFGVARLDGAVIFVSGAVKGDRVRAKIIKVSPSYYIARLEEVLLPSDIRENCRCGNSVCRSCAYRDISYEAELGMKREYVVSAMKKEGLSDIRVPEVVPSPKTTAYRNKAQYPIAKTKSGYRVGFYAPRTHNVCEAGDCRLSPEIFGEIISLLREEFEKRSLSVYDEERGEGLLRHIYLRRGEITGEIMLSLVINGDKLPGSDEIIGRLTKEFPDIVGIMLNENKKDTNVILGDKWHLLYGRDYIYDYLGGVKLRITAPSFYQINNAVANKIYDKARLLANPTENDTLLDLYCGAGSIALSMAKSSGEVIGIEIIEDAVKCAKINAAENGISNAHFFAGDAKNTEELLAKAELELGRKITPDIITLDPPRAGCDEGLIMFVGNLSPKKIVYISCNPTTLARDIKRFAALGYTASEVTPYDMFPGTGHVEAITAMTKQTEF